MDANVDVVRIAPDLARVRILIETGEGVERYGRVVSLSGDKRQDRVRLEAMLGRAAKLIAEKVNLSPSI